MSNLPMVKVKAATADEICAHFDLPREARRHLRPHMGPKEFVEILRTNKQYAAGIDFMAHALPTREAVWWGCLCFQYAYGNNLRPEDKEACRAAVRWIIRPTEQNRAAAYAPAQAAGPASPAGQLAMAASHSGGGSPTHAPPPLAARFTPAKTVADAVKLASAKADPVNSMNAYRLFLELGIGVAEGRFA